MSDVEHAIRTFLTERVLSEDEAHVLDREADLLQGRVLNSLTLVHLVDYIETTFNIRVLPAEFSAETFRTIYRICAFIETKRGALTAGGGGSTLERSA